MARGTLPNAFQASVPRLPDDYAEEEARRDGNLAEAVSQRRAGVSVPISASQDLDLKRITKIITCEAITTGA